MPSIPQSLLWISLVVLWLFVLVPMLISKRDNVKRTSDVALATRVLNTGGRSARLLRRRGPAAGHYSDPDWQPRADDDDHDYEGDDGVTAPRKTVVLAEAAVSVEPDYLDVDVVEEDSGALPVGVSAVRPDELMLDLDLDSDTDTGDVESTAGFVEDFEEAVEEFERQLDQPEPAARSVPLDATQAIRTIHDADFEVDEHGVESDESAEESGDSVEDDDLEDADGTDYDYDYVDDSSGLEAPETEQHAESLSRARSQRYESATAAKVSARKYRFRKRMLLAMGVALLASAALAFVVTPTMWWACGTVAAVTLLYLGYLRRQTRIEEQLRRRRAQRMARSRLGVENTEDRDFDVVPSRLRRPGSVVLEIDDEDPIFEHLEYVAYAREYDLPRAAGQ